MKKTKTQMIKIIDQLSAQAEAGNLESLKIELDTAGHSKLYLDGLKNQVEDGQVAGLRFEFKMPDGSVVKG